MVRRRWDKVAREYGQRCIDVWKAAAPNLTDDSFLDWATYTPLDIARRMPNMVQADWIGGLIDLGNMLDHRPGPILSEYRTPIGNLYMCGATQHPHGFVTFAPAYNALEIIAQDQHARTLVEMTAIADIQVRLDDDATSGLASIVQQFLEQQLADSTKRRVRASRLRGRLGLTATDYDASVTVDFRGDEIAISDGSAGPFDATIAGSYQSLTKLLQGRSNPLIEHLRRPSQSDLADRQSFFSTSGSSADEARP